MKKGGFIVACEWEKKNEVKNKEGIKKEKEKKKKK